MRILASAFIAFLMLVGGTSCQPGEKPTVTGNNNGHDFVDLGLPSGRLWATCNLGAAKPEENGIYVAWGEKVSKESYSWKNYAMSCGSGSIVKVSKYCTNKMHGECDNLTVLDAADDAATALWGKGWRTPTREEWEELAKNCEWKRVKNYNGTGIDYKMGTSKKNGNIILLPFSGYYSDDSFLNSDGMYWTSTLHESVSREAYSARVIASSINCHGVNRKQGLSVRAVVAE